MGAECARAVAQRFHDPGDRNYRRVAGEDGLRRRVRLDLGKHLLLERQILKHSLDDKIGIADRGGKVSSGIHPLDMGRF